MATIQMMRLSSDARSDQQAQREIERVWERVLAAERAKSLGMSPANSGETSERAKMCANGTKARENSATERASEQKSSPQEASAPAKSEAPVEKLKPRRKAGRPVTLVPWKRDYLLQILGLGQSRRTAAKRLKIDPITITRAMRRDAQFAAQVIEAEREGQFYLAISDGLFGPGRTVRTKHPVICCEELEREKRYLISKGHDPAEISRYRMRRPDEPYDPRPQKMSNGERMNGRLKLRPWKKGWRDEARIAREREKRLPKIGAKNTTPQNPNAPAQLASSENANARQQGTFHGQNCSAPAKKNAPLENRQTQ